MQTETLSITENAVLVVTADAPANLEAIYKRLNPPPASTRLSLIAEAVVAPREKGLIAVSSKPDAADDASGAYVYKSWFEATAEGKELVGRPEPSVGGRKSPRGAWKHLGIDLSHEDFRRARREAWACSPEEPEVDEAT